MFHLPRMITRVGGLPRIVADIRHRPKEPEDDRPFIPPGLDEEESSSGFESPTDFRQPAMQTPMPNAQTPFIPNPLYTLRPYRYRSSRSSWKHVQNLSMEEVRDILESDDVEEDRYPATLRIITWNVDMSSEHPRGRMTATLRYLEREVLLCNGDAPYEPTIICLQEVRDEALSEILADGWVRDHWMVTPVSPGKWPDGARYGNVTLISKPLTVVRCEMMHYGLTEMGRTALATYVLMSEPEPSGQSAVICVVNTHLESLPVGSAARPRQMELASRFLKQADVRGGVVVGDMNSINPDEVNLPFECGLRDLWKGGEKDKSGHTWGYQGQNDEGFPCARLDKVLFLPRRGYRLDPLERIGVGIKAKGVPGEPFLSDHYGLVTSLRLVPRRNSA